jgi:uncharacterized membrane protein
VESIVVTVLVIAGIVLWTRVSSLRQSLDRIERELKGLKPGTAQVPASPVAPAPSTPAAPTAPLAPSAPVARPWPVPSSAQELRKLREVEPPRVTAPQVPGAPSMYDRIESAVRGYFTGGNLVVRVGIIVLFFGVAFLLKYAAEHSNISIQMRLTGVALGAVALFVVGWRLRHRRRGFSLALQGGAIGVLYLTLFAALHLYQLLPASLTFALMAGLGIASCLLAVRQDSLAFSLLGATGGFLAPLLASTGSGSHVMLFSYYALLDAFVVWQAWFKAWRPLNLLAFIFTFGIGAYWGVTNYDASQFATTEPFLLFFFLAFVAIAVLFAFRRAPQLTHYVDGTLVFGTPLIASALQMHLVRDFTHGRAISALGAGVFYLALAAWLHRTRRETLKLLMESFLALGVAFLTLAVPLWFDDVWTAATWALEGAAVFWVGMRQQRKLASAFGVLLQLAAAVTFLGQASAAVARWPVVNAQCAGALLLSAAGLISARTATRPGEMLKAHGQVPRNTHLRFPCVAAGCLACTVCIHGVGLWIIGATAELASLARAGTADPACDGWHCVLVVGLAAASVQFGWLAGVAGIAGRALVEPATARIFLAGSGGRSAARSGCVAARASAELGTGLAGGADRAGDRVGRRRLGTGTDASVGHHHQRAGSAPVAAAQLSPGFSRLGGTGVVDRAGGVGAVAQCQLGRFRSAAAIPAHPEPAGYCDGTGAVDDLALVAAGLPRGHDVLPPRNAALDGRRIGRCHVLLAQCSVVSHHAPLAWHSLPSS